MVRSEFVELLLSKELTSTCLLYAEFCLGCAGAVVTKTDEELMY